MTTAVVTPARARSRIGRLSVGALGLLALALGTLQTVVDPALPLLQRELGVGPASGALVANAVLVTGAVFAPLTGKLGDRYGGKRVLTRLAAVVTAGGLLAGLAPNFPVLLLGQVLQGVMVGALPLSFILVRKNLSARQSQAAIGVVVALFTGGGIVGTAVAGPVAEILSWHWIFLLPTIVVGLATLAVARLMPHDPPVRPDHRIDWAGAVLLSLTLLALMGGLVAVTSADLPPLVITGLVVLVPVLGSAWVAVERRVSSPMVDLRLLAGPSYALTFFVTASLGMTAFLIPQLLSGDEFDADTTTIGLLLLPAAVLGALSDSAGGLAARRFGSRAVVTGGALVMAVSLIGLALTHDETWQLALARVLVAIAAGIGTTALLASTAASVDPGDIGIATSLLVVIRVIGVAVGAQVAGALLSAFPSENVFFAGFLAAGALAGLSVIVLRLTQKGKS